MLQSIRDKAQGWVAWLIVGLLVVVFAVWGIGSWFTPDSDPVIVEVDGQEIHLREVRDEIRQTRDRLRRTLGERYDDAAVPVALLQHQVINQMVDRVLLDRMSVDNGMRISDVQLAAAIRSEEVFQRDGQFSAEVYRQQLQYRGLSEAGYEQRLRRSETIAQIESGLRESDFATRSEVDFALALLDQRREVYHLSLDAGAFEDGIELTEAAVETYYQDHPQDFSVPEEVVIEYLELSLENLASQIVVDEAAVAEQYEVTKAAYTTPESRRARHILIEVPASAEPAVVTAAEERIAGIKARIDGGEDFAALAGELSDDPGSAAKGGDLGFFGPGAMVPAFDQVAFELEQSVVSDPVRSAFGFHLIEIIEIKPEQLKPLAEVRETLVKDLQRQQAEQQFYDLGEMLANVAYEQPDSLGPAAEAVGLEIAQVGPLSREGGDGIAARAEFLAAAFRPDLITSGLNSDPIELGPETVVVLRVAEHHSASPKPLDEVRTEVEQALRKQLAAEQAQRLGKGLLDELKGGADAVESVAEHGREWVSDGLIGRDNEAVSREIRALAFSVAQSEPGAGGYAGAPSGDGAYVLVRVTRVEDGQASTVEQGKRQAIAREVGRGWANAEFAALLASLRAVAEIKTYLGRIP